MAKKSSRKRFSRAEGVIIAIALLLCAAVIGYAAKMKTHKPIEYNIGDTKAERIEEIIALQKELFTVTEFNFGKININTATSVQLQRLEGIGEKKAADIIVYREQNGTFNSIEDIMKVQGIGQKTFEKFKDDIEV